VNRTSTPIALGAIALALLAMFPLAGGASGRPTAHAASGCAGASDSHLDVPHLVTAVLCMHNAERSSHGLGTLQWSTQLSTAASRHAQDMVRRHYFSHRSPAGGDYMRRVAATGYTRGASCYAAGENLLFGHGRMSAAQMLQAWMASAPHRRNILQGRWREFGLGVVLRSPSGEPGGVTIVAVFGKRSSRGCV
jgi:uncharacterized protein YkwD